MVLRAVKFIGRVTSSSILLLTSARPLPTIRRMTDLRYTKLSALLVDYSTELKRGDRVLLDMIDVPDEFTIELMRAARKAGAIPLVEVRHTRVSREIIRDTNDRHAALVRDLELSRMKKVQSYIAIRGSENANENSDVPTERMALYSRI